MKSHYLILLFLLGACTTTGSKKIETQHQAEKTLIGDHHVSWHYDGDFNDPLKDTLKLWMTEVLQQSYHTLGNYPFEMRVFFHPAENNQIKSPVPFGQTSRKSTPELHFYIRSNATYQEFMDDWTAPHEISHLSAPYFGKENMWISEGYATYLSRRIMLNMGYFTEAEFEEIYLRKIGEAKAFYQDSIQSFADRSRELFQSHRYGTVYWGSAGFFYQLDELLQKKHEMRLEDLIKKYQQNGRNSDETLIDVIHSWDAILHDKLCDSLLSTYENSPAVHVMERF